MFNDVSLKEDITLTLIMILALFLHKQADKWMSWFVWTRHFKSSLLLFHFSAVYCSSKNNSFLSLLLDCMLRLRKREPCVNVFPKFLCVVWCSLKNDGWSSHSLTVFSCFITLYVSNAGSLPYNIKHLWATPVAIYHLMIKIELNDQKLCSSDAFSVYKCVEVFF